MNKNDYKNLFHKEWERIIEILENGEYKTFKYKACPNLNEMEKLILREIGLNEDLFHNRLPCDYAMSQANENSTDKFCEFCPINWKKSKDFECSYSKNGYSLYYEIFYNFYFRNSDEKSRKKLITLIKEYKNLWR